MKDNYINHLRTEKLQSNSFVQTPLLFFVIFFSIILFSAEVVGQVNLTWKSDYNLPSVTVAALNSEDINVAIATDRLGNVYTLTFGNGVQKRNPDGSIINKNFITNLDSPLDIAIDENGLIYIADFQAGGSTYLDNGQIKVYDSNGVYKRSILTSYFRPMGIDVDADNVYIAEYNDGKQGPESTPSSRIRIVDKTNGTVKKVNNNVNIPYRIAVSSDKTIYVSQAGNNSASVNIYNDNLTQIGQLSGIKSPGSVIVDELDYVYVIDYDGKVDFEKFISLSTNFDYNDLIKLSHDIYDGDKADVFKVKIYDSNENFKFDYKSNIDFPIDLAFNTCDKLYIDNSKIDGFHVDNFLSHTFFPTKLSFSLEIYQRSPSFDATAPVITCPPNIEVKANEGNNFAVVTFQNATATDANNITITQTSGQSSGSQFPIGDSNIEFTATDLCGNKSTCNFIITVLAADNTTDSEPPVITCPNPISNNNDAGKCGAIVNFQLPKVTDNSGETITPVRTDNIALNSGDLFPVGTTTLTYSATDSSNNSSECSLLITISDNEDPKVTCAENIVETIDFNETGKVVNYTSPSFTDNCSAQISQTSGLASGSTFPVGATTNTFLVTDASGNTANCSFTVTINQSAAPSFDCPDPGAVTILPLDENCNFSEPDYSTKITNFRNFKDEPIFVQNSSRTGNTLNIKIEVYDGQNGNYVGKCEFPVTLQDQIAPTVTCLEDKIISYTDNKTFTLGDYTNQLIISDNCSSTFDIVQTPAEGTVITDDTRVTFTVIDENNNQSGCSFNIKFYKNTELQILNCPGDQTFEVNSNCSFLIPDIASNITTSIEGATITQNISPGFEVNGNLTLTITAKFEDQVDTCEVKLIAKDSIDPSIICPGEQNETIAAGEGFQLPNYILNSTHSDNCYIAEITQQPEVGTVIYESTQVTLSVKDGFGNTASCSFMVNVSTANPNLEITCPGNQTENLDANCEFILPDYTMQSQVNFQATVTQDPLPGTAINSDTDIILTAKGDEGVTTCIFTVEVRDITPPVANCVGAFDLRLNANGQASLNAESLDDNSYDACGIISKNISKTNFTIDNLGENTVTFTVTDAAGSSDSCETIVNVLAYDPNEPDFTCKDSIIVQLDENGEAKINPADLYIGNGVNYQFSIDKSNFTCDDKGSNNVLLSYSSINDQGSCTVEVIVEDLIDPIVRAKDITITLDANGRATISPEMLDNGTTDNCGTVRLFLDQNDFSCKDIGENRILLRGQDESSNLSSDFAVVTVVGNCDSPPTEPLGPGYIYIYPNPTDGPFTYYLPNGITLNKVEVYDMQGKYIMTQEFPEATVNHSMDLSGLQNAVYVLKLYTSEGEKILRVIVY